MQQGQARVAAVLFAGDNRGPNTVHNDGEAKPIASPLSANHVTRSRTGSAPAVPRSVPVELGTHGWPMR